MNATRSAKQVCQPPAFAQMLLDLRREHHVLLDISVGVVAKFIEHLARFVRTPLMPKSGCQHQIAFEKIVFAKYDLPGILLGLLWPASTKVRYAKLCQK